MIYSGIAAALQRKITDFGEIEAAQPTDSFADLAAVVLASNGASRQLSGAELCARIVQHLREESAVSGFWDNPVSQEEARRWIFQHLDNCSIFDFGDLDAIASDCMGVARANRAAFTS